ncbi:branched-chain amino acid ABC transporter permease [Planktomarina temperata]|jgi:branched-chain amino acid transport system permease protein|uniref:branched-chain amino acid ABC transporter permease n=1 Tax=Planktomarina temperata TaxID=1284658 RepID=UPI00231DA9E8|nr:branched-chain amino acid ABC transporter permease [Planktomarina temperata]MDB2323249.1 branched-chain amino acid ABC transporter permease [Planktomarina temperata]MDB2460243.1 branched-chain amino acid ABC transporter permease [Planktomarina temperata]MDB4019269.1 branched-chain amino acid ABC transporter permease [Planktomarina temperata]MDC0639479.1 branched-chain amino acid ABC transporter permease [Planktomarina temperata]
MTINYKNIGLFFLVACLILGTGFVQSWNTALFILNMGLVSAIMALGVNLQWGFAGLFNVGIMGFVALGGLAAVLISMPPTTEAWAAGGLRVILGIVLGAATVTAAILVQLRMAAGRARTLTTIAILIGGFFIYRAVFDGGVAAVEAVDAAGTGYLGGLNFGGASYKDWGFMTLISWPVGGLLAAGVAWLIGKTALGLRSDYLAIATLGISEIIIAVMKNEDWLSRGVKNVIGLPRPVPYEIELQESAGFIERTTALGLDPVTSSSIVVKLGYAGLFSIVLVIVLILAQLALASPWGRMMRAIRDNEEAAEAMGKNVTARHLQIFILGSAICGVAGAMMTTLDSQLTPSSYQPLRFTFLVWVMVIVGGSGNNFGSVLGGFLIFFLWVQVEPMGAILMQILTSGMAEDNVLRLHLLDSVAHMRLLTMGLILILVLRFAPKGLIPEK